jgi:phage-related minor tail protein
MAAAAAGGSAALLPIIGTVAVVAAGVVALGFAVKHVSDNWDTYAWALNEAWTATTGFISNMGSAIGEWVNNTTMAISDMGTSIYDSIAGAFERLTGKIGAWFSWVREKFVGLGSSIKGVFTGGDAPAPIDGARASGGPVSAGKSYLVGERGPEIFSPSASGSIIPNNRAGGSVSNDNRTITINITASPGMNERTLADLVLARLDGRQAALAGGALYD